MNVIIQLKSSVPLLTVSLPASENAPASEEPPSPLQPRSPQKSTTSISTAPTRTAPASSVESYTGRKRQSVPTARTSPHPSVNNPLKRLIDIAGGLVGVLITGLVAIPIAIALQLDNPGPLFYSQLRCGVQGKPFRIWKFRSMVVQADALKHLVHNEASGSIFKNRNDPRVTRVGRWLRKTSLDEFPQFLNVLRGEMSLVGTRPPTVDEVLSYKRHHWQRLNVKPGITGEWQANGRSTVTDFEEIVKLDLRYQEKWSLGYDLAVIYKTILGVLKRDGAC
jgi:lipopolysaccharide/colanic/teichoic acid biosynthesis glycosyltransferase